MQFFHETVPIARALRGLAENDGLDFWRFVGNPIYRMLERSILEDCRHSEEYKKKLFEKIEGLITETRPDKALLEEREERRKKHSRNNSLEI